MYYVEVYATDLLQKNESDTSYFQTRVTTPFMQARSFLFLGDLSCNCKDYAHNIFIKVLPTWMSTSDKMDTTNFKSSPDIVQDNELSSFEKEKDLKLKLEAITGENEKLHQVIKELELKLGTANKERREEEIRVLKKENEVNKEIIEAHSELHVLKKEQQGKKRFEWTAFSFNVFLLALSLGNLMQADVSWWSWWHSSILGGIDLLSFFYANLLFSLFKFVFVYFP